MTHHKFYAASGSSPGGTLSCSPQQRLDMLRAFANFPPNRAVATKMLLGLDAFASCDVHENANWVFYGAGMQAVHCSTAPLPALHMRADGKPNPFLRRRRPLDAAFAVLNRMRFVGLTECFAESAELFMADAAVRLKHHRVEWPEAVVTRASVQSPAEEAQVREEASLLAEAGFDGYDLELRVYQHAARLLAQRLQRHNVRVKSASCARALRAA